MVYVVYVFLLEFVSRDDQTGIEKEKKRQRGRGRERTIEMDRDRERGRINAAYLARADTASRNSELS